MNRAKIKFSCVYFFIALSFVAVVSAQRNKEVDPTSELTFVILKDDNGKPIRNAAVIMHTVSTKGKQGSGGLELKTDPDGKASIGDIPYGKLRVQVLASGFQTFGEDYEVSRAQMEFTIKLKRPQDQFTVYGDDKKAQKPPDPNPKPQ